DLVIPTSPAETISLEEKEENVFQNSKYRETVRKEIIHIKERNFGIKNHLQHFLKRKDLKTSTRMLSHAITHHSKHRLIQMIVNYLQKAKYVCSEANSKCRKSVGKLKQEFFTPELFSQESSIEQYHATKISETLCPRKVTSGDNSSIDETSQHLDQLCDKAFDAEDRANRANQKEILCWSLYAKDFRIQHNGVIENSGEVIDYGISSEKLPLVTDHVAKISKTLCPGKILSQDLPKTE
ncbi:6683_t:CDS:2, partial [Acaulospora morrowiae]